MNPYVIFQKLLPQHLLSRAVGRVAASERRWIRAPFIRGIARAYGANLDEAERTRFSDYRSFNDFFTRALRPGARPIDPDPKVLVAPADGKVSQAGVVESGQLLQAKGIRYAFADLADACAGTPYEGGAFLTVYLSPKDYHRVHVPAEGRLTRTVAIPGTLFSVDATTERGVPGLFARNERLVSEFETPFGKMLVIMVGAMIVASIETVWPGPASPYRVKQVNTHDVSLAKGAEMGRFLMGSTVITVFERGRVQLEDRLIPGVPIRMGQGIGRG